MLQKESQREVKEKHLALFQLATARIKFTSLKTNTSSLKKEIPINDKKTKGRVSGGNQSKMKGSRV